MKYDYQLTKEDWGNIRFLMDQADKTFERGQKIVTIFLIIYGLGFNIYCLWNKKYMCDVIFYNILLMMYGVFIYVRKEYIRSKFHNKMNTLFLKRKPQFLEPQTISIENNTIVNTIGNYKVYKKSIDDIMSFIVLEDFIILIVVGIGCMTAIPSRVFSSEEERNQLIEILNKNNKIRTL